MVLITGASGFIGSYLHKAFPNSIGLDKVNKGQSNFIHIDLLDKVKLFWALSEHKIHKVIHCAAFPSVPASYETPMTTYQNNVSATINLIDVCRKLDVEQFVFASTSSVHGPSPYGHSKKVVEEMLKHTGIPFSVLRFFNVFGKGQRQNVLQIMYDRIINNEEVIINGDGSIKRDFTYIDNVVNACVSAISSQGFDNILEVGTGQPHTLIEAYRSIREVVNIRHDKLKFVEKRHGDLEYSCAKNVLTDYKIIHFEEGIKKWLKSESLAADL